MTSRRTFAISVVVAVLAFSLGGMSGWIVRALFVPRELPVSEARAVTARSFKVLRVLDGNSFEIRYDDEPTIARIEALDTPMLTQPGGKEAREALARWIENRTVHLIFPAERKRDAQGRLLVRVSLDDDDLTDVGTKIHLKEQPTTRP